ncbi:MAG TPA: O-antigen ligase family protein [Verrucomicrobiae bacterium]|nr:O-antigen ligase family protein [Verrucomicrobiae bacterium]
MNREALDKFFERGILALVLAILVFAPLAIGAVDPWEFLVVQGLTIGVSIFWLLRIWLGDKSKLLWPPVCWVALAFVIYAVARYLTADIEYVARQELIQILVIATLFFSVTTNLYRQEFSQIISFTVIALAMGISCFAVYQFATHHWNVWGFVGLYPGRATGTYISPNDFACFLEMILPLTLAYILVGRIKPLTRILLGYCALAIGAGIFTTFSRGGWVAAGIGVFALLIILVFSRHHRLPALFLLILLFGGGVFMGVKYLPHTAAFIQRSHNGGMQPGQIDLNLRRDLWTAAIQMWQDHFWLGVGPAHYNFRYPQYRTERMQFAPDRVHNDYLNLLADWGTVGGIIVAAGIIAFIAGLLQTRRHVRRADKTFGSGMSNRHAFFLGAGCGLLALAAHSAIDFNLHIPANAILGATLLALVSSNLRFATERFWLPFQWPARTAVAIFLLGGITYLGWQESRHVHEQIWLSRAELAPNFSPERAADLEKAFAVEPKNPQTAYDIGECYRVESFDGGKDFDALAQTATDWFSRGIQLNPFNPDNYFRCGMCLDWLGRHEEAEKLFWDAEARDPNSYFVAANFGWHYFQAGDYAAARAWCLRSQQLQWNENKIAAEYLELSEQRLLDQAEGKIIFPGF